MASMPQVRTKTNERSWKQLFGRWLSTNERSGTVIEHWFDASSGGDPPDSRQQMSEIGGAVGQKTKLADSHRRHGR